MLSKHKITGKVFLFRLYMSIYYLYDFYWYLAKKFAIISIAFLYIFMYNYK